MEEDLLYIVEEMKTICKNRIILYLDNLKRYNASFHVMEGMKIIRIISKNTALSYVMQFKNVVNRSKHCEIY